MKAKENRTRHVPTDQPQIQNINLVTGDKFNYDRPLITEREIKQLCIDVGKKPIQKFMLILKQGEKIQKWSIFQNMHLYIGSAKDAHHVFEQINKNYNMLGEFLAILGQGLANNLQIQCQNLSKQSVLLVFQLAYRTLTQNPSQVQDWSQVFQKVAHFPFINTEKCLEFINGSFSMNAPPDRRRVAFCMIRHLMQYSKQISKVALTKVLFFNKDQNPKTRYQICYVMKNILSSNQKEDQVWKSINEYLHDKDNQVREIAMKTICTIFYLPNFQIIIHLLSQDIAQIQTYKHLGSFIVTFKGLIASEQRARSELFSFLNRTIKSKKTQYICILLNNLTQQVLKILGQGLIFEQVNFGLLPLKNKQILQSTLSLCHRIQHGQFQQAVKNLIFKSLKQNNYVCQCNCTHLAEILDLTQEDQINIYLSICNKLLQLSKWYQIVQMLSVFKKLHLFQSLYDRSNAFLLRLWMSCPAFMVDKVIDQVLYLVLINRKNFQFLITIRQKIMNSKSWNHRKNYLIFYSALKRHTSFSCHKFIPMLNYGNINTEKIAGVKLTLAQYASTIYKYTDPTCLQQKAKIKQVLQKLQQDKDIYVRKKAEQARQQIIRIDKNPTWASEIYERNKELTQKQLEMQQISPEPKKTIKTQNEISKSTAKSKRRAPNQHRRTINVGKVDIQKDISIDSISMVNKANLSNTIQKKNHLFRCHSVKMKAPPTSKKTEHKI